jgi:amino acid adenylation domain-containing protein
MQFLLYHAIDQHATTTPDHTAFRCGDREITYAELAGRTNQLAHLLKERGVNRGDRVGIYLGRSLETAIAVHGILKAGAAYVPLDPDAPVNRTRRLIADCDIRCLISSDGLRRNLSALLAHPTGLDTLIGAQSNLLDSYSWATVAERCASPPGITVLGGDLAYVMYTSGSTGQPKGIMHTHRSGLAYARLSARLYGVTPEDIVGNHCALHYDISTFGYFTAPLAGATTVIVTDAHTKFPLSLLDLIKKENISVWYSVPLALLQLTRLPGFGDWRLPHLRWILFGGEVLPPRHLRALMRSAPNARASNVYGPAEVNQCTYRHFDTAPEGNEPLPLGAVWENTEILIVDDTGKEVAPGRVGELLVRSATCMQGYWNRPDLTEAAFYLLERVPGLHQTFYRTGDLVYANDGGELVFAGRKDRQVKVRGHRVELEEVEALLAAQRGVGEVAVYVRSVRDTEQCVAALVVPEPGQPVSPESWREALAASLPSYCLPDHIHVVPSLPRNDAGKIDRLAIRDQYATPLI